MAQFCFCELIVTVCGVALSRFLLGFSLLKASEANEEIGFQPRVEPEPKGFQVQKPGTEAYLETHGYTTTTLQFFLSFFTCFFQFFCETCQYRVPHNLFLIKLESLYKSCDKEKLEFTGIQQRICRYRYWYRYLLSYPKFPTAKSVYYKSNCCSKCRSRSRQKKAPLCLRVTFLCYLIKLLYCTVPVLFISL